MKWLSFIRPATYLPSMLALVRIVWARKVLLWEMGKRDIRDRYAGHRLGTLWAVVTPLITMMVYLFIFVFVFRLRMGVGEQTAAVGWGGSYALYLLSGLIPWLGFQEVLNRSTTVIADNSNLVKQIIFPLEILPLKLLWSACAAQGVALAIFLGYGCVRYGLPAPLLLLLPWLLVIQLLASAGVALLLSGIGPFFPDVRDVVGLASFVLLYCMPIFFTREMLPPGIYFLLLLNPLSHMIECYHDVLYWGAITSPLSWIIFPLTALALFALGCRSFLTLKKYFGNVL